VAAESLASHVTLVELDADVAAVWETILLDDARWLANRITHFNMTPETVRAVLDATDGATRHRAFRTIIKNRVNRGGILAPGAGLIKQGENGRGLLSRWYPATLAARILDIHAIRDRLSFRHDDGLTVIAETAKQRDTVYFIDPPYTAAGKRAGSRLYSHSDVDHERLFSLTATVAGDFLMTYDDSDELRDIARSHGFDFQRVSMKNTHHAKMTELLIGRNLDWAR
jgi:DNA adenine methylase